VAIGSEGRRFESSQACHVYSPDFSAFPFDTNPRIKIRYACERRELMNIQRGRLVTILVVVAGILVVYLCYWYFLVPPLKVFDNGMFNSLSELGPGRILPPEPDKKFLVVVVKVNHWPGPLMSKDFELQYYRFPSSFTVECYAMNTLPIFTSKAGPTGFWGQNVTLQKKSKYPKLVFVIPPSATKATLIYRGQRVSEFTINSSPFD